jgi:hypothetical protein
MNPLDHYLEDVKKYLPWQGQDDILAELRTNLEAQLEDKEAELGRPLSAGEMEAWIKRLGPPMQMAARYQPQQYLIGPAIFPIYWFVLRLALLWAAAIYVIANAVHIAMTTLAWGAVLEALLRLPEMLVTTAAWITLVFAVLEFATARYPSQCQAILGKSGNWPADALPSLEKSLTPKKKQRTYAHAVAEVVFGVLFMIWLLLIPQHPYVLMGPGAGYLDASPFRLTPIWFQFYWWVVALNAVQLIWRCVDLALGRWQQSRLAEQIAVKALGLIPLILLLSGNVWVTLKQPMLDPVRDGKTAADINQGIHLSLTLVCVIVVLQIAWEIGRAGLDAYRKRVAAAR